METISLQDGNEYVIDGSEIPEGLKVFKLFDKHIKIAENLDDLNKLIDKDDFVRENLLSMLVCKALPYPRSVYKDVYVLSKYDRALIKQKDYDWIVEDIIDSPFLTNYSRNDQIFKIEKFESILNRAVSSSIKGYDDIVLLLSDGKDSVPIALALNNLGIKARCFTFAKRGSKTHFFTEKLAKEFGHEYHLIDDEELSQIKLEKILSIYEKLLFPTVDFSSLIYVFIKLKYLDNNSVILDGSGNDLYFGYTLKFIERASYYSSKFKFDPLAGLKGNGFLQDFYYLFGITNKYNLLPLNHIKYWNEYSKKINKYNLYDKKLLTRGRHLINGDCMNKARYFQLSNLLNISFPWMNDDLVNYVFHLPETQKRRKNENKICLRRFISDKMPTRTDHIFKKRSFAVRYPGYKNDSLYEELNSRLQTKDYNLKFRYLQIRSTIGSSF